MTFPVKNDLKIYGGTTFTQVFPIDTTEDLTGATAQCQVRKYAISDDVIVDVTPLVDEVEKTVTLVFAVDDTYAMAPTNTSVGTVVYDIKVTLADTTTVIPVTYGKAAVTKSVTRI